MSSAVSLPARRRTLPLTTVAGSIGCGARRLRSGRPEWPPHRRSTPLARHSRVRKGPFMSRRTGSGAEDRGVITARALRAFSLDGAAGGPKPRRAHRARASRLLSRWGRGRPQTPARSPLAPRFAPSLSMRTQASPNPRAPSARFAPSLSMGPRAAPNPGALTARASASEPLVRADVPPKSPSRPAVASAGVPPGLRCGERALAWRR